MRQETLQPIYQQTRQETRQITRTITQWVCSVAGCQQNHRTRTGAERCQVSELKRQKWHEHCVNRQQRYEVLGRQLLSDSPLSSDAGRLLREIFYDDEDVGAVTPEVALRVCTILKERERTVIIALYLLDTPKVLREIADVFATSKTVISRLRDNALRKLRHPSRRGLWGQRREKGGVNGPANP